MPSGAPRGSVGLLENTYPIESTNDGLVANKASVETIPHGYPEDNRPAVSVAHISPGFIPENRFILVYPAQNPHSHTCCLGSGVMGFENTYPIESRGVISMPLPAARPEAACGNLGHLAPHGRVLRGQGQEDSVAF